MIVYIQSKSGGFNSTQHIHSVDTLQAACWKLRTDGGYYYGEKHDLEELFVPFEQIEYIKQEHVEGVGE